MSTSVRSNYHHGDLRSALLDAAMEMVEAGEQFSLRAVARRADVSQTAPYRHFADREALESALAVRGFQELGSQLTLDGRPATSEEALVEFGVVYVNFSLTHPGLFKLMFGQECDDSHDSRVVAAGDLRALLRRVLAGVFPDAAMDDLAVGAWGLVHGLAFLHLDGKLPAHPRSAVATRVRAAFAALLTAQPAS